MTAAQPEAAVDIDDELPIDWELLTADDLPETDDPALARVYEYIREANADRIEAADLRRIAEKDLEQARALAERAPSVAMSPDDAAFLKAKKDNRLDVIAKMLGLASTIDLRRVAPKADNDNQKPTVTATPFVWKDPKTIPRREWLYGSHYARKYLSATFGAGGGGKTAHSYTEALAMASGKPLLGEIPRERRRVWTINLEDPTEEIDRRVMAAALHYSLRPGDIEGYLWTDSGREQRFVVARSEGRDIKVVEPVVAALIAEIKERQIDVLIVDPFVSTHGVPENDNNAIQAVAEQWVRVAHEANCSVELVHHVRKSNGQEATADDGRGAGALKDKARSVRVVNGMTKEEAEKAGIPADQARRYFRIDFGKVNMVASSSSAWRRFVSVSLGNGGGMLDPADQIGVVESWRWPSAQDIAGDVPAHLAAGIMSRLSTREYRENEQATGWAGNVVAEILGLDIDDKAGRAKVRSLLKAWLQAGDLRVEERHDHKRMLRKYIVPATASPSADLGGAEVGQGSADSAPDTCLTTPLPRRGEGVGQGGMEDTTSVAPGGADPPGDDFTPPAFLTKSRTPAIVSENGAFE